MTAQNLKKTFITAALALAALPGAALAAKPEQTCDSGPVIQLGNASWYGRRFHGRQTANGETFNMHALTAAHKTLPLGTEIEVENLANGKTLVVRVNDRGPYAKGRILDLSRRAATLLGYVDKGVTRVAYRICQ